MANKNGDECERSLNFYGILYLRKCKPLAMGVKSLWWLVWRSVNDVRHINEVKLRRARLVLESVTTCGWYTIPVFIQAIQAHSTWPSLGG